MSFFTELKRRNVYKVGVAYAIVAWLLIQIAGSVLPTFAAPGWVLPSLTFIIILGFPIALILAWAFEMTPEGIKPTGSVVPEASTTKATGQKLNVIIFGLMALAIAFLVIDNYVLVENRGEERGVRSEEKIIKKSSVSEAEPQQSDILPNSVAVLPFENMSPDKNNAYFADGLHEEILNQLAKLRGLNVIARTTMRQYANTDKTPEQIARDLKVQTVMEGSVRYADGVVRVTAQLIDGKKDVHLWSETYDRPFKDIFGIESDIAMNVANAMAVAFSTDEQAQIETSPTKSSEAYDHLMLAQSLISERRFIVGGGASSAEEADKMRKRIFNEFQKALVLDPGFGLAQVRMVEYMDTTSIMSVGQPVPWDQQTLDQARERAFQFAPELPAASVLLSRHYSDQFQWQLAEQTLQDLISRVSPNDYEANRSYGEFLLTVGRPNDAIPYLEHAARLDPLLRQLSNGVAFAYDAAGDNTRALAEYKKMAVKFGTQTSAMGMFWNILASGDDERALKAYIDTTGFDPRAQDLSAAVPFARMMYAAMSNLDNRELGSEIIRKAFKDPELKSAGAMVNVAFFAAYFGEPELSIEAMRKYLQDDKTLMPMIWSHLYQPVRKQPGFKKLVTDLKLVDYWRKTTWPLHCRPIDAEDFECD